MSLQRNQFRNGLAAQGHRGAPDLLDPLQDGRSLQTKLLGSNNDQFLFPMSEVYTLKYTLCASQRQDACMA